MTQVLKTKVCLGKGFGGGEHESSDSSEAVLGDEKGIGGQREGVI
jgi:hypothetical protein